MQMNFSNTQSGQKFTDQDLGEKIDFLTTDQFGTMGSNDFNLTGATGMQQAQ